jgi:hypothetical protein
MKNKNEIARMRMLAGLITEGQYRKLITEVATPNWENIDEYKSILDDYFDTYNFKDPKEFIKYSNGELMKQFALDIALKAGFKGNMSDLIDEEDFNIYCNMLAKLFLLKYSADMSSTSKDNSKYEKEIQLLGMKLPKLKAKAQSTIDKIKNK